MAIRKYTAKQWVAIVLMELIILAGSGFLIYQFVIGLQQWLEKRNGSALALGIFCLVMAVGILVGLNILMVVLIRRQRAKGSGR